MQTNLNDIDLRQILVTEFEKIRADIIVKYKSKNMQASGRFERELEVEYEKANNYQGVVLWGSSYTDQLEYGRRPSQKMPPLQAIFDWIVSKRIMANEAKSYKIKGLAFAIARKIQREGWKRESHGGVGLISEVITDKRISEIIDKVGAGLLPIFEATILTMLKDLENDNIQ